MRRSLLLGLTIWLLAGCAAEKKTDEEPPPAELDSYVLDAVPADIEQRTFIDFEGKVQIIGYSIEPKEVAKPGDKVKLTLYWQSVSKLGSGWKLFTHLLDPNGRVLKDGNVDKAGPLRGSDEQALPPSRWQPGKVYVDTQEFQIPADVRHATVTISVGIWNANQKRNIRLDLISGPHDAERRALIATLSTGVTPPKPVVPAQPQTRAH